MFSIEGLRPVVYPASFGSFVPVLLSSVSDPCPYPSCLCLPLRNSFLRCPSSSQREGATAARVLSLGTLLISMPGWLTAKLNGVAKRRVYPRMRGRTLAGGQAHKLAGLFN